MGAVFVSESVWRLGWVVAHVFAMVGVPRYRRAGRGSAALGGHGQGRRHLQPWTWRPSSRPPP